VRDDRVGGRAAALWPQHGQALLARERPDLGGQPVQDLLEGLLVAGQDRAGQHQGRRAGLRASWSSPAGRGGRHSNQ
jgi:hypothetical protein